MAIESNVGLSRRGRAGCSTAGSPVRSATDKESLAVMLGIFYWFAIKTREASSGLWQ